MCAVDDADDSEGFPVRLEGVEELVVYGGGREEVGGVEVEQQMGLDELLVVVVVVVVVVVLLWRVEQGRGRGGVGLGLMGGDDFGEGEGRELADELDDAGERFLADGLDGHQQDGRGGEFDDGWMVFDGLGHGGSWFFFILSTVRERERAVNSRTRIYVNM
jgi:hypothetical protein